MVTIHQHKFKLVNLNIKIHNYYGILRAMLMNKTSYTLHIHNVKNIFTFPVVHISRHTQSW